MKKRTQSTCVTILTVLALVLLVAFVIILDGRKPVVFRSITTGEIVRAERNGVEISPDEVGDRYHLVWVK
jgi:hypothetical protein